MRGIAKFLLVGLVGAALGVLISRKRSQNVQREAQPLSTVRETPRSAAWVTDVEPGPVFVPETPAEPEAVAPPQVWPPPLEPTPVPEPMPVPDPALEADWEPFSAPAEEAPAYAAPGAVVDEDRELEQPVVLWEEPGVEPISAETDAPDFGPDFGFGPVAAEEVEPPPAPIAADDLKARIEETRRRIRRELEEPFVTSEDRGGADASVILRASEPVIEPLEPVIGDALEEQPSMEVGQAAPAEDGWAPEALADESPANVAAEAEETREEPASKFGPDYDAMRSRIEATRNRLKAKAFDAMMTGESALLGRDTEDVPAERSAPANIDNEIVQTIESTLREEDW